MRRVYLDHAASTPLREEARSAMLAALDVTGNASSLHGSGRHAARNRSHRADGVQSSASPVRTSSGLAIGAGSRGHHG